MRHAALLFAVLMVLYFSWRLAGREARRAVKAFLFAHAPWIALISCVVVLALAGAFHSRSINIL